jgi:hypothetical protein
VTEQRSQEEIQKAIQSYDAIEVPAELFDEMAATWPEGSLRRAYFESAAQVQREWFQVRGMFDV